MQSMLLYIPTSLTYLCCHGRTVRTVHIVDAAMHPYISSLLRVTIFLLFAYYLREVSEGVHILIVTTLYLSSWSTVKTIVENIVP